VLPLVLGDEVVGREPRIVASKAFDSITLPPNTATMDDCYRIGELLYGHQLPQPLPLTVGFLELVTTAEVVVDVVYTATDLSGRVLTMDVERVEARTK
jgi:hypothetical protein